MAPLFRGFPWSRRTDRALGAAGPTSETARRTDGPATGGGKTTIKGHGHRVVGPDAHHNILGNVVVIQGLKPLPVPSPPEPLSRWDARRLGVHAAVPGAGLPRPAAGFVLPTYVQRPHDLEVCEFLSRVADGQHTELLVLRGGSCTGKTRTAYEGVRAQMPAWDLVYPKTAAELIAACELGFIGTRTVVWLDDAHRLLAEPAGEEAAVGLRGLLERPHTGVVIATIWPKEYDALIALPKEREASPLKREVVDPHRHARKFLLSSPAVSIPEAFTETELASLERAALSDPALKVALASVSRRGAITQSLAAGPDLLDRWVHASDPWGKAVLTAAIDARRLGVRAALPLALLRGTALGYLDLETVSPDDWFEQAMAFCQEPVTDLGVSR